MYRFRIADNLLKEQLKAAGVVVVEGPKWCGKTTTAEQAARSVLYLDNPQKRKDYLLLAESNPGLLLEGDAPRLLDEWQLAPQLWDAARLPLTAAKNADSIFSRARQCLPTRAR